jgi:beta-galactosidase
MKIKPVIYFLIVLSAIIFVNYKKPQMDYGFEYNPRQKLLFDFDWKFFRGDVKGAQTTGFDDSDWRTLDLPHDWSIEDLPGKDSPIDSVAIGGINTGYYTGGTGWYRKTFIIPSDAEGKIFKIMFDGVYMNTDVWLNGVHLGNHPYGYTAFEYDITNHLKFGEKNVLAVQVKNEGRNSRWYSGSGIYRHVWLTEKDPVHVKTWGVAVTTPMVERSSAKVDISVNIENQSNRNKKIQVQYRIFNSGGEEITVTTYSEKLNSGMEITKKGSLKVSNPELWSPATPVLYKAVIEIMDMKGKSVDRVEEKFGIRTIDFSVTNGFLLNGEPLFLKGGCMHHDNGPLGAAAYDRAEERRVEMMKASGFNAIRAAHNPPSVAFLDACDRLGILVINESFDMWRRPKNPQDYSLYFDEHWKNDIEAMVLRDRNHPSIIMWSTGNEIPERGEAEGAETSKMLADYVRKLDPTRPVTAAVNGLNPDKDPYFATLDISGYNYSFGGDHGKKSIFQIDHERVPDRIMYCAESYPLEAFGAWMDVLNHPYVLGDFVWTSFDYLGESSTIQT